jgi:DNA-binding SARP family transcriptional activator
MTACRRSVPTARQPFGIMIRNGCAGAPRLANTAAGAMGNGNLMQELLLVDLLGQLRVSFGPRQVPLGSPKQQAVLVMLASWANRVVSRDQIIDGVWGGDSPPRAANAVHTYVAGLRRALEPGRTHRGQERLLVSTGPGYLLRLGCGGLDVELFERSLNQAREQWGSGDLLAATSSFGEALALWRGLPFPGVRGPFAEAERDRLGELRLTAIEDRAEVMLAAGRHAEIVAGLSDLTRDQPLRERAHGLRMLALYRSGRQAEALEAFTGIRRLLIDELGVEPNPRLQRLHQRILTGDAELGPPRPTAPPTHHITAATGSAPEPDHGGEGDPSGQIPQQLPREASGFTGRHAELARLHDQLLAQEAEPSGAAAVIGVISGTAGVGKTSLAVHWAHRVASRFPDGQLHVNLRGFDPRQAPLSPGDALSHLLRGITVAAQRIPGDVDDQAAMLRTLLARKRMLLLLDNAATARQLRPLLPGSPHCLVLVTSRNDLAGLVARDGAHRIPLEVLSTDESVALLARVIGAQRVEAEPGAAVELARLCGGLPLALRIAAERAAGHPRQTTLAELAAELAVENRRLDALAAGEDEDTAVRDVFSWSYRVLAPQPARMFRLLGLHTGPELSASAAAALANSTTARVRPLLTTLVRRNLLQEVARDRYRLHELLRIYAAEHLTGEDGSGP